jgi:hypothetical protein
MEAEQCSLTSTAIAHEPYLQRVASVDQGSRKDNPVKFSA